MKMIRYVLSLICGLSLVACGGKDEPKTTLQSIEKNETAKPAEVPQAKPQGKPQVPDTPPANGGENKPPKQETQTTKRPDDHYMAIRSVAEWSVEPSVYLEALDLDALILDNQAQGIDLQTLAPYIRLYATTPESAEPYVFTAEDMAVTTIQGLRYDSQARALTFELSYKGIPSGTRLKLELDKDAYFGTKVTLNSDFAPQHYLRGTSRRLDLYAGEILRYDRSRYAAVIDSEHNVYASEGAGTLRFNVKLYRAGGEASYPIAILSKTLTGFRPLTALKQDLKLSSSYDLQQYFKQRLAKANVQGDADVTQMFGNNIELPWSKHLMLTIRGTQLVHQDRGTFVAEEHTPKYADLYFEHMRFTLHSARLQGRDLILELSISSIDGYAVEGLRYTVSVFAVRD